MTEEEWRSNAWGALDDLAKAGLSGPDGMARALVRVAMLMKSAPQTVYRRYAYANAGGFGQAVAAAKTRLVNDDHPPGEARSPLIYTPICAKCPDDGQTGALERRAKR